jgi:hypothetical protein
MLAEAIPMASARSLSDVPSTRSKVVTDFLVTPGVVRHLATIERC